MFTKHYLDVRVNKKDQEFYDIGILTPLGSTTGQYCSIPTPKDAISELDFKEQAFCSQQLACRYDITQPITRVDNTDLYIVQVLRGMNKRLAFNFEIPPDDGVSTLSARGPRRQTASSKVHPILHESYSVVFADYKTALLFRGAPDYDESHREPGIHTIHSTILSQIYFTIVQHLQKADAAEGTDYNGRFLLTCQRYEVTPGSCCAYGRVAHPNPAGSYSAPTER